MPAGEQDVTAEAPVPEKSPVIPLVLWNTGTLSERYV